MKTLKFTIVCATLIVLNVSIAQAKEKKEQISNTKTASCLVKVAIDPAILPLNLEIIDSLLASSSVAGKAGREILDISHQEAANLFTVAEKIFKSKSVSLQAGPSSTRSKTSQIVTNYNTSI